MKKLISLAATSLVVLFLLSCASGPKFTEVQPAMLPESLEMGRIFFYRSSAFGAALNPVVYLNDEPVGKATAQGFFFVDRPPGNYEAVTSTEVERKVTFTLEKEQTRFIKFHVSMGFFVGHVYGKLVDETVGLSEIKKCKYTGETTQ